MTTKQMLFSTLIITIISNTTFAMDDSRNAENTEKPKMMRFTKIATEKQLKKVQSKLDKNQKKDDMSREHEKNISYGYPQLPSEQSDFYLFDAQKYEAEYQKAIDRELNITITQEDMNRHALWPFYRATNLETTLIYNLCTIRRQKMLNPEYIAAEQSKQNEHFTLNDQRK